MRVLGLLCGAWVASAVEVIQDADEDLEAEAGGVVVKFVGKSGKFRVSREGQNDTEVEIEVDEVTEVDENDNKINSHRVPSVASQDFEFTVDADAEVDDVPAHLIKFETDLEKANTKFGEITVYTYLMKESGEVGPNMSDTESVRWSVQAGTLKFNIGLADWSWHEDGKYVDVYIAIKGLGDAKQNGNDYDLGGGSNFSIATEVSLDGQAVTMPTDYPKLDTSGNKQIFIFRFPHFDNEASYDPILDVGQVGATTTVAQGADDSSAKGLVALTFLMLPVLRISMM